MTLNFYMSSVTNFETEEQRDRYLENLPPRKAYLVRDLEVTMLVVDPVQPGQHPATCFGETVVIT